MGWRPELKLETGGRLLKRRRERKEELRLSNGTDLRLQWVHAAAPLPRLHPVAGRLHTCRNIGDMAL